MFRSRSERRNESPDAAALEARNAVTQAFLALDDEQRAAAAAVAAAVELGTGARIARSWADIAAIGDAATEAYLTATRDFPLDGTGPVAGSRAADQRATAQIEKARESIRRFRATHSRVLDDAALALDSLPRTVRWSLRTMLNSPPRYCAGVCTRGRIRRTSSFSALPMKGLRISHTSQKCGESKSQERSERV